MLSLKKLTCFSYFRSLKMSGIYGIKNYAHTYRIAMESDRANILNFLNQHYYPNEPISINNNLESRTTEDGAFLMSQIQHGTSLIAVDILDKQKVVGALVSGPIGPDEADKLIEESKRTNCKQRSQDLRLFAHLRQTFNIHERFNVSKVIHSHAFAVEQSMQGATIGYELLVKGTALAKLLDYQLASGDTSSSYGIKLAEKCGMVCVNQVAYADYKDSNGVQIYRPPSPHTHIKTYVYVL